MTLVFWIFLLGVIFYVCKIVINLITKYNRLRNKFSKGHFDYTEKGASSHREAIEMIEKNGVWEIVTKVKSS